MDGTGHKVGLRRDLGFIHATSLAITDMVGIGPFITIPLFLATMGGPQAMLGWLVGAGLAFCDGLVWPNSALRCPGPAEVTTTFVKPSGLPVWDAGFRF